MNLFHDSLSTGINFETISPSGDSVFYEATALHTEGACEVKAIGTSQLEPISNPETEIYDV